MLSSLNVLGRTRTIRELLGVSGIENDRVTRHQRMALAGIVARAIGQMVIYAGLMLLLSPNSNRAPRFCLEFHQRD